jgi:hypothetical protein
MERERKRKKIGISIHHSLKSSRSSISSKEFNPWQHHIAKALQHTTKHRREDENDSREREKKAVSHKDMYSSKRSEILEKG